MVRLSKQTKDRSVSPRRPRPPAVKSGRIIDSGKVRMHLNAAEGSLAATTFIPKIK